MRWLSTAREERAVARDAGGIRAWLGCALTQAHLTSRPWRVRFDGFPPVFIRFETADLPVLHQVFRERQYAVNQSKPPKTIVDAGAHIGLAAVYFATAFPQAEILAIEPDEQNFALLQRNTRSVKGVTPIQAALVGEPGFVRIANPEAENWEYQVGSASAEAPGTVRGMTVSEILDRTRSGHIDLLKLDIEGAEAEVLRGSDEWIDRVETIAVELHDRFWPGCTESFERATRDFPRRLEVGEVTWASRSSALALPG
jgi:FkbM family methyltransferase